jgi:hypothetical protein
MKSGKEICLMHLRASGPCNVKEIRTELYYQDQNFPATDFFVSDYIGDILNALLKEGTIYLQVDGTDVVFDSVAMPVADNMFR